MIKACLFDFDYTLVDSHIGIVKCFRIVLERHQFTSVSDDAIKRTIGKTLEKSFSILTGITDDKELSKLREEYRKEADIYMNSNTHLFPDTVSTLTTLKESGLMVGIISTKYRFRFMDVMNKYFSTDFFDILIGGEDIKLPKPHPESIYQTLDKLHISPNEMIYVGDSTVDGETAQNAAVPFIGVTTGMTTKQELAAYPHLAIIKSLQDLLIIIRTY
ncbi:MAG: HAD-IA family hydrolase [Bacteroidales bacterium]|nr:HAD-IA family hydrolase [Bacteroidales bacterium]